jgi:V8-like Glu-specific endopeptidase
MSPRPASARRRRTVLIAALGLGAVLLGSAPAASATVTPATASATTATASAAAAESSTTAAAAASSSFRVDADPAADLAYWTPERLAAAMERGAPGEGSPHAVPDREQAPSTAGPDASAAQAATGRGQRVAPVAHIGRLFGVDDVGQYECSANVVQSGNRSTIATAGHCVVEHRYFSTHLVFFPAYDSGESALGAWPVVGGNVPTSWYEQGDDDDDAAFLAVARNAAGADIQSVTGASPVVFDAARVQRASGYGYPAEGRYDGETLTRCQGTTAASGSERISFLCDMTPGVSGGPLFIGDGPDGPQFTDMAYGDDRHCDAPAWHAEERSAYDRTAAIDLIGGTTRSRHGDGARYAP